MQYIRRFWVYGQCHCNTCYFGDHSKSVIKPYLYYDIFDVASRFFLFFLMSTNFMWFNCVC